MGKSSLFSWKIIVPLLALEIAVTFGVLKVCGFFTAESKPLPPPNADLGVKEESKRKEEKPAGDPLREKPAPWDYSHALHQLPKSFARFRGLRTGILVDLSARRVIWEKDSAKPVPVASLTKMMTALLIMEKLEDKNSPNPLSWETILDVSDVAVQTERSGVLGMQKGERYSVGELMAAMMIASYNDAAAQLAEAAAGDVPTFVQQMNERARELGLRSASFNSPNGLPQGKMRQNSLCSAADIAILSEMLLRHPKVMELCGSKMKKLHTGRVVYGHNGLLKKNMVKGYEGFKTGFTNKAGFCLSFGINRDGRRIIGCVTGFPSAADRDNFCRALIEWAYGTGNRKK